MATQPMARHSAGTPAGGQFAPIQMSETPVELDMWDPHEGTFQFPPRPRDARDVIYFWMRVEIPDEVCFATRVAYTDRQNREVQEELANYERLNPPPPKGPRRLDAWLEAEKEHVTAWEGERRYTVDQTRDADDVRDHHRESHHSTPRMT